MEAAVAAVVLTKISVTETKYLNKKPSFYLITIDMKVFLYTRKTCTPPSLNIHNMKIKRKGDARC